MPATPHDQRAVLFVDDDELFLDLISRVFAEWSRGSCQVYTAESAAKALALLQEKVISLVAIDLQMPVVDGAQFLNLLNRKYPNVVKVVLTAFATEVQRAACLGNGAELFLEKPKSQQDFESVFSMFIELMRTESDQGFQGVLRQVGLPEVIQLECLSRHSVLLEVVAGSRVGEVYIRDGSIVHARFADRAGEHAFYDILGLKGGSFNLKPFVDPSEETISAQWESLLMEAARVRDESAESTVAPPASANWDDFVPVASPAGSAAASRKREEQYDLFCPKVAEVVVASSSREILYEWQCPDTDARLKILEAVADRSRQIASGLPVGEFRGLEVDCGTTRLAARISENHSVLVQTLRQT